MRNFVTKMVMVLALFVLPSVASAQTQPWTANFTTGTVSNPSYNGTQVGPYAGTLSNGSTGNVPLPVLADANFNGFWCLDFVGGFGGGPVVVSSFAQLIAQNNALTTQLTNVAKAIKFYEDNPTLDTGAEIGAIHEFIWNQFNTQPNWPLTTPVGLTATTVDLDEFFFVEFDKTSDGVVTLGGRQELAFRSPNGGNLETTVPEPSTYALMTAGLIGIFGVARRRKNASA